MIININTVEYRQIKNLSFVPETDITAGSLPINEFQADIISDDALNIKYGDSVRLYNDQYSAWALYTVVYAERLDTRTVRIRAYSPLFRLESRVMSEHMYQSTPIADVIREIRYGTSDSYTLDRSFDNATITGFCPEQTARERLQWVCFVLGAYVKTYFGGYMSILPVSDEETLIPLNRTFWKPTVSYGDYVTAVRVTAFTFTKAENEDAWKQDDSSFRFPLPWIATEQDFTLYNPDAPSDAPENVVEIDELYLVNSDNASAVVSRLAQYYFKRAEVTLDCVNNGEYIPGQRVAAYIDEDSIVSGYIQSASFTFGTQARSTLKLTAADERPSGRVNVEYWCDSYKLGRASYVFPVDYGFSVENPYLDMTRDGHRYIYRPLSPAAEGIVTEEEQTVDVYYEVALDLYMNVLDVKSVDDISLQSDGKTNTGVIQ